MYNTPGDSGGTQRKATVVHKVHKSRIHPRGSANQRELYNTHSTEQINSAV
jgi:hypothetical protein